MFDSFPFFSSGLQAGEGGPLYALHTATLSRHTATLSRHAAKREDGLHTQEAASTARPLGCRRDTVHLYGELLTAEMGMCGGLSVLQRKAATPEAHAESCELGCSIGKCGTS